MRLGLIGYPLGHSWSPAIHSYFLNEDCYSLWQLEKEELDDFFAKRDFDGINVTIPYKQEVMKYLDEIDPVAKRIGAVNTIVNRNGKLTGYNTDYLGFAQMLRSSKIEVNNCDAAVLGSGGVSKAIEEGLKSLGARVQIVSRNAKSGVITYEQLYETESKYSVIVNATPVGMSPKDDEVPVDLSKFTNVHAVIDAIANPLRTKLIMQAKYLGYQTCGGFEMLVRQALIADELFTDSKMDESMVESCMNTLLHDRRNIVFIGMPSCGKSTIGRKVAKAINRPYTDMDKMIEKKLGTSISECFALQGEDYFRDRESDVALSLKSADGIVISTGGGVIKREENMIALAKNAIVVWIDRDLKKLKATDDRPLSSKQKQLEELYEQRKPLYQKYCDVRVKNNTSMKDAVNKVIRAIGE